MSWLDALRQRAADLRGHSRDRDLDEEIAYHLELETARQISNGCDPVTARARAIARFGNSGQITDATRDERGAHTMEGGMQDLRWAARSLRKSPGFTALALFTLTLGIGATTVAFTVLDSVLLKPLPYREADRLVFVREQTAEQALLPPSYPNFVSWREAARSFSGVASAMSSGAETVWPSATGGDPLRVTIMGVSRRFFAILGVTPIIGREFTGDENIVGTVRAAMVSYEFWQTQMGGRMPLGSVRFDDTPISVVGVLPPNFRFINQADLYFPHEALPGTVRSAHNYLVVARLAPTATLQSARAEMTSLSKSLRAIYGNETQAAGADVRLLRDYLVADYRTMLAIVFGAAALVLLIACTNLTSALLARGRAREREIVVRAALGASRTRLVRQLVLESGLLVLCGAAMGTALAGGAIHVIGSVGANLIPRLNELGVDARVGAFVVSVAVATVLVVGVYPAFRLAHRDPGLALRDGRGTAMTVRAPVWRLLVGFEIALAVVLLIGSTLLIRTLHNILTADTGFDSQGIVTAAITPRRGDADRLEQIRSDLSTLPGVTGAAFTSRLPLSWGNMSAPVRRVTDPGDHDWPAFAGFRIISSDYFAVLRQPVVRGRAFTNADRTGAALVAVITPGIAEKLWPGQDPIGRSIGTNFLYDQWLTVVGVVAEASSWTMPRGSQNEIYVPLAQHPNNTEGQLVAVVRTAGDPAALIPAVRARLRQLYPGSAAQLGTMDERIERSAADRRFAMLALTAFGVIALLLAAVGIYGVIWYIVTTRTHDIGVRMALGATGGVVQAGILRDATLMALGGIAAGILGGVFATRYLQATLYGVSRLDPRTYVIGGGIALCTALLGAYIPARHSSRIDPMVAIRGE
ncbi:MAG: ABC transporter permease [bacterium]